MSTDTTTGGFIGDPAAAFTPQAAGGCCGSTPAAASTCCGSLEAATQAGACCDPVAKVEAIDAGAGCCG